MQIYRILFKHAIKKAKKYRYPSRTAILRNYYCIIYTHHEGDIDYRMNEMQIYSIIFD